MITPPLKWHGGKHYLANDLVSMMPPHLHYVEPFAGGLSVLLAKDAEGVSEVVNDIHHQLSNFWRVLQSEERFAYFARIIGCVPFSEYEWDTSLDVERHATVKEAVRFFIRCRQSMAGRMQSFAPLSRNRTRRGMNEQASAWMSAVDGLAEVHARLRRVVVLNRPAIDVIPTQDGVNTLFYLDPPYLPETRATPQAYEHEMTYTQHDELLAVIRAVSGKVMISGYDSSLYRTRLRLWNRREFNLPNNSASGATKERMTEVVWSNF